MTTTTPKLTRTERILEPLGARHGAELISFFDMVAEFDCDLVIFMARKSLCLYRMMQICGAKTINVPVFSDTILENDGDLLRGKRILIVDDTLFVGTTLSDAADRLNKCNVRESTFWVYCADVDTWKSKTFLPTYIHVELSAQDAIEFCAAECRALINAGIPYLSDFAASGRIHITASQLNRAIRPVNWIFYDVSSQYHEKSKVKYYSGLPDQLVNERVKAVVGKSIFNLIEISKVRIFATWSGRGYDVTLIPLVTFAPCLADALRRATVLIAQTFSIDRELVLEQSDTIQMRLLQFLVGATYMKHYWLHFEEIAAVPPAKKLSFDWCQAVFSPELAEAVASGISDFYSNSDQIYTVRGTLPNLATNEPQSVVRETKNDIDTFLDSYFSECADIDLGHSPLSDLTAIMLEFQAHFEDRARQEVIDQVPDPKFRNRLKRGMAWRALCSRLLKRYRSENTRYHRNMLSLILDRLVDFGVAVPIVARIDGLVYRAYRHGEDVKFGAQEESLVHHLVDGFQIGRGVSGIEPTYFEKLLVILLRVGMNEEWLNLWYSNSGRDSLVRIGYHLQGAVPISPRNDDELVPEGETSWLTRRLCKTGTVTRTKGGDGVTLYQLGDRPQSAHARSDARRTARLLGYSLGKACIHSANPRSPERPLAAEDLIVLTSCSNGLDTTGAVAAELQIFSNWYLDTGNRVLRGDFRAPKSKSFRIKIRGSHGERAFNSAKWKINKFQDQEIDNIQSKVLKTREIDPEFVAREDIWEAVFEAFRRQENESESKKISRFISASSGILECCEFLLKTMDLLAQIGRSATEVSLRRELADFVSNEDPPDLIGLSGIRDAASGLEDGLLSRSDLIAKLERLSASVDEYARSLCSLAQEEAVFGQSIVVKANARLSRTQYRFMIWYDILDVRVRRKESSSEVDRYAYAIDKFRSEVSRFLQSTTERLRLAGGDLFVDTGEIKSLNDQKHIFLAGKGGLKEEANRLICDIKRIAEISGVRVRMLAVPTNLCGEYVFLNRGATDVGGDFKSYAHTLIQEVSHHQAEEGLSDGQCIVWVLKRNIRDFRGIGSVSLTARRDVTPVEVEVNIRRMINSNTLAALG